VFFNTLLGDDNFQVREEAERTLAGYGVDALPQLREALANPELEIRQRAERLIEQRMGLYREVARHSNWDVADPAGKGLPDLHAFSKYQSALSKLPQDAQTRARELDELCRVLNSEHYGHDRDQSQALAATLAQLRGEIENPDSVRERTARITRLGGSPTGEPVSDADLANLTYFPNLEFLSLSDSKVTNDGLKQLSAVPGLRRVDLSWTSIGDAGVANLIAATNIRDLDLSFTRVTDFVMNHLSQMNQLRHLSLPGTSISELGLSRLAGMSQLQGLKLDDNLRKTNAEHVQQLGRNLPNCAITFNDVKALP
jgi:hypothetical protein